MYSVVLRADTVDTTKSLNDTHRVPMDIVVNQIVAILQVLTLGDTVGSNQNINLLLHIGEDNRLLLRDRRDYLQSGTESL